MIDKIPQSKPMELSIICRATRDLTLVDRRIKSAGILFGTIESVAKQYGLKIKEDKGLLIFTAPKNRLQFFVEKLHFSGVYYEELV